MRPLTKEEVRACEEHRDDYEGYVPEKIAVAKMFAHIPTDWEKQWEDLVELVQKGTSLDELFEGLSEVEYLVLLKVAPDVPSKVLSDYLPTRTILNFLAKRKKSDRLVGEMTPEEQEIVEKLESIDLDAPATEEEQKIIDMLGTDFDKRVAKKTMERIKGIQKERKQ